MKMKVYHCWVPGKKEELYLIEANEESAKNQAREVLGNEVFVAESAGETVPLKTSEQRGYLEHHFPKLLEFITEKIDKEELVTAMEIINAQKDKTFLRYAAQLLCDKIKEISNRESSEN